MIRIREVQVIRRLFLEYCLKRYLKRNGRVERLIGGVRYRNRNGIITISFITFPFLSALNESLRKNGLWFIFGESWSSEKSLPSLGAAFPFAPAWENNETNYGMKMKAFESIKRCRRKIWNGGHYRFEIGPRRVGTRFIIYEFFFVAILAITFCRLAPSQCFDNNFFLQILANQRVASCLTHFNFLEV